MYDGYQVLRFENNYKSKDLYLIGNEMNNRVGTGNYDKERTIQTNSVRPEMLNVPANKKDSVPSAKPKIIKYIPQLKPIITILIMRTVE